VITCKRYLSFEIAFTLTLPIKIKLVQGEAEELPRVAARFTLSFSAPQEQRKQSNREETDRNYHLPGLKRSPSSHTAEARDMRTEKLFWLDPARLT
jgi:hypothetical protein